MLRSGRKSTNINMVESELLPLTGSDVDVLTVAVEVTWVPFAELSACVSTFTTMDEPFAIGVELVHVRVVDGVAGVHVHVPAVDPFVVNVYVPVG